MERFDDLRSVRPGVATVLTIGNFDGIHCGHQALIRRLREEAATRSQSAPGEVSLKTALLTFDPHPLAVLRPDIPLSLLTTPQERLELAGQLGLDIGVKQPFSQEMAAMTPLDFMAMIKRHLNPAVLVVGPDFALGKHRAGDLKTLRALGESLGYDLVVQEHVEIGEVAVHSSTIRHALSEGDVELAASLLGRPYHVTGVVIEGDKRGRTIGIPTANLKPPPDKLGPASGVYATRTVVHWENGALRHNSVTNVGVRPTVDGLHHRVETHILDLTRDQLAEAASTGRNAVPQSQPRDPLDELYDVAITVEFWKHLRAEQRFSGLDELVAQIRLDIEDARRALQESVHPPGCFGSS